MEIFSYLRSDSISFSTYFFVLIGNCSGSDVYNYYTVLCSIISVRIYSSYNDGECCYYPLLVGGCISSSWERRKYLSSTARCAFLSNSIVKVHDPQAYRNTEVSRERNRKRSLTLWKCYSFQNKFSLCSLRLWSSPELYKVSLIQLWSGLFLTALQVQDLDLIQWLQGI